jgi:hypothetical protein
MGPGGFINRGGCIGVFGASEPMSLNKWPELENEVPEWLHCNNFDMIYCGFSSGMIGKIAANCLEKNIKVSGVLVKDYHPELEMPGIETQVVASFHMFTERIFAKSEAFIILPGGSGTLAELSMLIAMKGAALINKAINIINPDGWFNPILDYYEKAYREQLIPYDVFRVCNMLSSTEGIRVRDF